jgi:hypothetical protein
MWVRGSRRGRDTRSAGRPIALSLKCRQQQIGLCSHLAVFTRQFLVVVSALESQRPMHEVNPFISVPSAKLICPCIHGISPYRSQVPSGSGCHSSSLPHPLADAIAAS